MIQIDAPSKMRVLHVAAISRPSPGIQQQMRWEQEAADLLGITWRSEVLLPESNSERTTGLLPRFQTWKDQRKSVYRELLKRAGDYDVLLLRYSVHDFFLLMFLLKSRKPVVLVHHTIELEELLLEGKVLGKVRASLERIIGHMVNRHAAGQIAVTQEILESVLRRDPTPAFAAVYPNGVMPSPEIAAETKGNFPELLFVSSSFHSWQGLDRLISSMKVNENKFKVHLVGLLTPEQLKACNSDSRFITHGVQTREQIQRISTECCIGIAPLALDRKGLTQGSALKVREYLDMGLPVVADHDDLFPTDWPFYMKIATSPNMLVPSILNFAEMTKNWSKSDVRALSAPFIYKSHLLRTLYEAINTSQIQPNPTVTLT